MTSLRVNTVSYIKKNHTNETRKIFSTNKNSFYMLFKKGCIPNKTNNVYCH